MSFTDKQARMNTFNYKVKMYLKAKILSRCNGNLNNGLDNVNIGRMFNNACTTIVFKFFFGRKQNEGSGIASNS